VTSEHDLRRQEWSDAGLVEELRSEVVGELFDLAEGQVALLGGELLDPSREGFQGELGAAELGVMATVGTGCAETSEQSSAGDRPQLAAQGLRR
jgi:hypothetical protein